MLKLLAFPHQFLHIVEQIPIVIRREVLKHCRSLVPDIEVVLERRHQVKLPHKLIYFKQLK